MENAWRNQSSAPNDSVLRPDHAELSGVIGL
jgi:hypothetical protein